MTLCSEGCLHQFDLFVSGCTSEYMFNWDGYLPPPCRLHRHRHYCLKDNAQLE